MVVKEMGLESVKFEYTGGDRGWPGDVPQVRFNTEKMEKLGWKPRYTSDQAVERAVKFLVEEIIGEKACSW
jgi:UDP-glucose 4-epimerase